jgi:two-component system, NarL family, sensor histidine kinase UhpB
MVACMAPTTAGACRPPQRNRYPDTAGASEDSRYAGDTCRAMSEESTIFDATKGRDSTSMSRRWRFRLTPQVSILWRVFTVNALVSAAAVFVLIISPATVHAPIRPSELVVLLAGLLVTLLINLALLTFVLAPIRTLVKLMGGIDPLSPGQRAAVGPWASSEAALVAQALNGMLDRLETERRESARRALAAQEAERVRVARELHDEVGQALTAIALRAEGAAGDHASQTQTLRDITRVANESLGDVRRISRELRPEALDDLGLSGALTALCLRLERQSPMRIARKVSGDLPKVGSEVELAIYRVAQEALTNALRHSGASQASVALECRSGGMELTVADNGRGGPAQAADGGGLAGMRERALLVDAVLEIAPSPGEGLRVSLVVPTQGVHA